ncbi:MAG TPA: GIY-YIG nuclease family protein, partial [Blastocatellia bacterium]|nr:GIY-YIG nuclease family protein [Blastocatellia bacterium]
MLKPGYFEIKGTLDELLPKLRGTRLKQHGVVYFADFGDGVIKVGKTRGAKSRFRGFDDTIALYHKREVVKFGISPILANYGDVETTLKEALHPYWEEVDENPLKATESFRVTEAQLDAFTKTILMDVLRSCMWPA